MKTLHLKLLLLEKNQFNLGILFSSLPGLHVFRQSLFFIVIAAEPRRLNSWAAESVDADTDWPNINTDIRSPFRRLAKVQICVRLTRR